RGQQPLPLLKAAHIDDVTSGVTAFTAPWVAKVVNLAVVRLVAAAPAELLHRVVTTRRRRRRRCNNGNQPVCQTSQQTHSGHPPQTLQAAMGAAISAAPLLLRN